jgi:hypothetical protein
MGKRALQAKRAAQRRIRKTPLSPREREALVSEATYEGSPHHKRNPGDFGLNPPAAPRPDKTLCDEAGVFERRTAERLLQKGIENGVVSEATAAGDLPKQIWVVDERGRVFEAMHGSSGCYHGYPIRDNDPLFEEVKKRWGSSP